MNNSTETCPSEPLNLDDMLNLYAKFVIMFVAVSTLIVTGVSLYALIRTKHTPQTARFLASGLLLFDFGTTMIFTVRKLISDPNYNRMMNILGVGVSVLAYVNIAIMCVERLLVFQWPNFYLRRISFDFMKTVCFSIWITFIGVWIISTGRCTFITCTFDVDICFNNTITVIVLCTCPTTTVASISCMLKIIFLIRKHTGKLQKSSKAYRSYKSTAVVFFCVTNYVVTTLFYAVILMFTIRNNFKRRVFMDSLMLTNGLLDTFVYVLWYKECRLELLKLVALAMPSLNEKVEKMKLDVFDIVTQSNANSHGRPGSEIL